MAILLAHNARAVYLSSLPAHCMFVEALTTFRVLACMQVVRTSLTVVKLQLVSFGVSGLEILFALTLRNLTCARLVLHLKACQTYLSMLNL